jgi:hypothetical protein
MRLAFALGFMADLTSPLDNLLHSTSAKTLQYERQLKELEVRHPNSTVYSLLPWRRPQSKLSEHLGNARTIDASLRQVYASIQVRSNQPRVPPALAHRIISGMLDGLTGPPMFTFLTLTVHSTTL